MKIDAVAFDLDGTLIETKDAWLSGLNKTLRLYGKTEEVSKKYFIENHVGVEQTQVLLHHLDLSESELEEAVDRFNEIFVSSIDHVRLQNNVLELLEYVSGFAEKTAIITNAYSRVVDEILDNLTSRSLDIRGYFDMVVTRDTVKEGKPNPEIIYITCERLGVQPENMVFVEDSTSGVIAGKRAGCYVIGYTSNISGEKLREFGADITVSDLLEIKGILSELAISG